MNWLLPEYIADALPAEAERIGALQPDYVPSHFQQLAPALLPRQALARLRILLT